MTPVFQSIVDSARGDCFSACIASILDLPLAAVPSFCAEAINAGRPGTAWANITRWLQSRGFGMVVVHPKALHDRRGLVGLRAICRVPSQGFPDTTHAVVGSWRFHDPAACTVGDWVEWFIEHDPNLNNAPYPENVEAWDFVFLVPQRPTQACPVRFGRHAVVKPRSAMPEEVSRAAGETTCDACGKTYQEHRAVVFTDDPEGDSFPLILNESCDGRLWKL